MQWRKKSSREPNENLAKIFVAGIALLLGAIAIVLFNSILSQTLTGDGDPKIISNPFFVSDGYTVQFKPVSLDRLTKKMTYHFRGLPRVAWRVEVYFVIEGSQDWRSRNDGDPAPAPNTVGNDDLKGTLENSAQGHKRKNDLPSYKYAFQTYVVPKLASSRAHMVIIMPLQRHFLQRGVLSARYISDS